MADNRAVMFLVLGSLALGAIIGSHTCAHEDSSAQVLNPTSTQQDRLHQWYGPAPLRASIDAGYADQMKRLYLLLYDGYLTRPGFEQEENEKFMRGVRTARRTRNQAQLLLMTEPWYALTPIPDPH